MLGDDYLIQSIALPYVFSNWAILKISFTQIIYTNKFQLQSNLEIAQSMYVFFFNVAFSLYGQRRDLVD